MSKANSTTQIKYRPIDGFPGYRVGSDGTVWSCKRRGSQQTTYPWRQLSIQTATNGYQFVSLAKKNERTQILVHKLVLTHFVGPRPVGMECAHNNGIKTDNRVENLRWTTKRDNCNDRWQHGTMLTGAAHPSAKLNKSQVLKISELLRSGKYTKSEIGAMFNVGASVVSGINTGDAYVDVTGGPVDGPRVPRPILGENHPDSKLTASIVGEARNRFAAGERSCDLAKEYGVSTTVMHFAIRGKTWKHAPGVVTKTRAWVRRAVR